MGELEIIPNEARRVTWMTNPFDDVLIENKRSNWYPVERSVFLSASRIVFEEGIITSCHYDGVRGKVPSFRDFISYRKGKCEIDFLLRYSVNGVDGVVNIDSHINRNKMSCTVADRLTIKAISFSDLVCASKYLGFPISVLKDE